MFEALQCRLCLPRPIIEVFRSCANCIRVNRLGESMAMAATVAFTDLAMAASVAKAIAVSVTVLMATGVLAMVHSVMGHLAWEVLDLQDLV